MNYEHNKLYFPVDDVKLEDLNDWFEKKTTTMVEKTETAAKRPEETGNGRGRSGTRVTVNEEPLALFRFDRVVFAIQQKCPHAGGPLHLGDIESLPGISSSSSSSACVRCPWHRWCFSLQTGKLVRPEGRGDTLVAKVWPVRVNGDGRMSVGFDSYHPKCFRPTDDAL